MSAMTGTWSTLAYIYIVNESERGLFLYGGLIMIGLINILNVYLMKMDSFLAWFIFFSPLLWTENIFLLLLSSAQNLKWCNLLMNDLWGNLAQPVVIIIIIIYQIPIFLSVFLFFYPQNLIILFILPDPETIFVLTELSKSLFSFLVKLSKRVTIVYQRLVPSLNVLFKKRFATLARSPTFKFCEQWDYYIIGLTWTWCTLNALFFCIAFQFC